MIKRYTYDEGDGNWRFPGHVGADDGEWVHYEDHLEIVKKLEERIAELEGQLPIVSKSEFDEWWDKNIGGRENWG